MFAIVCWLMFGFCWGCYTVEFTCFVVWFVEAGLLGLLCLWLLRLLVCLCMLVLGVFCGWSFGFEWWF